MKRSRPTRSRTITRGAAAALALQLLGGLAIVATALPAPQGSLSVVVTDDSLAPLENVSVQIVDANGNQVANLPTDASGLVTILDLAPGTYYARTYNSLGYIDELYDGFAARSGNFADGTPITVTEGGTEAIAFRLDLGGLITGQVTDEATGDPIAGVWIDVYDHVGRHVGSTPQTDATGAWATPFGLSTGNYYLQTHNSAMWVDELFDDVQSYNWVLDGSPVAVTIGGTTSGIDIALELGAQIQGTVTGEGDAPLGGVHIQVMDASGRSRAGGDTAADGTYTTGVVPSGTYYVQAWDDNGHIGKLYNDIVCWNCGITGGTPVEVAAGANTTGIDFELDPGGRIAGTITDEVTTEGIANVWVDVYDESGRHLGSSPWTDGSGEFLTTFGLPTGMYYVFTSSNTTYVNEAYDGLPLTTNMADLTPVEVTEGETVVGIDFALAKGGRISGRATEAGTGVPLAWAGSVAVFSSTGTWVTNTGFDGSGRYITTGLPAGTYYLVASSGAGHIGQIYNGVTCLNCGITGGTPVAVTVGATTSGIDFAMVPGGTIEGTITDAVTTEGVGNAWVDFYDATGHHVGSSPRTGLAGSYRTQFGLPSGSYFARTWNTRAYLDEAFDDVPCASCNVTSATQIFVTVGTATSGVDFALTPGGLISGRVTNSATGDPIAGAWVDFHNAMGQHVGSSPQTDAGGYYTTQFGLPTGTYYANTNNNGAFVNEAYDNLPMNTSLPNRTPIAVTAGATTPDVDFQLDEGGTIAGQVFDADSFTPLAGVGVSFFNAAGQGVGGTSTDTEGYYVSTGLAPGTYYAKTERFGAYIMALYADTPFIQGDVRTGVPIDVEAGITSAGIDFALVEGGQIAGHVTAAAGGAPLGNISLEVADASGSFIWGWEQPTDVSGAYITTGLPAGTYYIRTNGNHAYVNECYDNLPFGSYPPTTTPVTVTLGNVTGNIDFALSAGAFISGQVIDAGTLAPLAGVPVSFFDASGQGVGGSGTDTNGNYVSPGLPAGTYYAKTERFGPYIMTLYDGTPFIQGNVTTGTPISLTAGATTADVDFALVTGGQISGHITNADGGALLANVSVEVADASGQFIWGWEPATDATGAYSTTGLPAGTYYIRTNGSHGFVNEFYDNLPFGSIVTSTTAVTVAAGAVTSGIDFELGAGGFISGVVLAEGGGFVAGAGVSFYDSGGQYMSGTGTSSAGAYVSPTLPAGSYYVVTNNNAAFINEVYDNVPCVNCPVTLGALVPVTVGNTTSGISFALAPGGRVSGRITNADGGAGIPGVWVDFHDVTGHHFGSSSQSDAGGYYTAQFGLPTGTYYANTNNNAAFINEAYDNLPASTPRSSQTPIVVAAGATTANIDFQLSEGGRISGHVTADGSGAPIAGVQVQVSDTNGQYLCGGTYSDATGAYTTCGLPAGTYFLLTYGTHGYVNEAYDNVPFNQNPTGATPVVVTLGNVTPNINFQLSPGGFISGVVRNEGGVPLTGGYITFQDSSGNWLPDATVGPDGTYLSAGLAAGTYIAETWGFGAYLTGTQTGVLVTVGATTPNIDFALVLGGQISGHVTVEGSGLPVANVRVELYDSSGQGRGGVNTDASGYFITNGLAAGTYFLKTSGSHPYVNELYDNLPVGASTTSGAPVSVTLGAVTQNIDFALAAGGRISGTIRNQEAQPLAGVGITFSDSSGQWAGYAATDASGSYQSPAMAAGSYYLKTERYGAYIQTIYPNVTYLYGSVTVGTAVPVTVGSTTPNIDFTLVRGGQIAGQVTAAAGGAPLAGVNVELFTGSGQMISGWDGPSDAIGAYLTRGLPAGTYFIRTAGTHGHVNEFYDNLPFTTTTTSATPVVVALDTVTPNINFQLAPGGFISGTITNALAEPVPGIRVTFYNSAGSSMGSTQTNTAGVYTSNALPAGSYYLQTNVFSNYIQILYPDIPYLYGSVIVGTAVPVTVGNTTGGIDMTLTVGGQIAGNVTDALSTLGIPGIYFTLYTSTGQMFSGGAPTGPAGTYITRGLPAGTYYLATSGSHPYVNELYNNLPGWTQATSGTPLTVTLGAVTGGIDFGLDPGGRFSGRVTAGAGGAGVGSAYFSVHNSSGQFVGNSMTDSQGYYTSPGVPSGTYYATVYNPGGNFLPQLYSGIYCQGCTLTTGTPIAVTQGVTTPDINFPLATGGRIAGAITDNTTTLGVPNTYIELFNSAGTKVGNSNNTDSAGVYTYQNALPAGTYYAHTQAGTTYTNEVYDNLPIWTPMISGSPITVSAGATVQVNAALDPNPGPNTSATAMEIPVGLTEDRVFTAGLAPDTQWYKFFVPPGDAGKTLMVNLRVTSPYPDPIPSGWNSDLDFELLDGALTVRAIAMSGSDNEIVYVPNVASGWYYVYLAFSTTNYADTNVAVRYDITVETGTDYGLGFITGRLLDSNGQGVEQVFVRVTAAPFDNRQVYYTVAAGPGGYFTAPTTPGPRDLLINGDGNWSMNQAAVNVVQEFYSDRKSINEADHVWVAEGETANVGDITLAIGAIVTGRVTNGSGSPLMNAQIYGFTPDGFGLAFASTNANGEYTLTGVPVGGAKIRFNRGSYAQEFYDDQATLGQAGILATESGVTISGVDAVLTVGGRVTGTVQNTSGAPIAAGVRLYSVLDSANSRASATSNASTGAFTFSNVKPGQYKILFSYASVGFAQEWYNDAASFADAAVLTVTEGGTVAGINAQLAPVVPEVDVTQGATPVASGGTYGFGPHMTGTTTDVVFTISNPGTGGLTVAAMPLVAAGPDAYQFSIVAQPVFPVLPGTSTTFTVRFTPASAGPKSAYLSFGTNDADENPYVVNLSGAGITEPLTPVITWPPPAPITAGTPLSILQLNAQADVPGTFAYTPGFGAVLGVGAHTLSVHFTPDDAVNYTTADTGVSLTVLPLGGGRAPFDFTGDGQSDILWRHTVNGDMWLWGMEGPARASDRYVWTVGDTDWEIRSQGDQDGDGTADLLWRHKTTGMIYFWWMSAGAQSGEAYVDTIDPAYDIIGTGDFDGDGKSDLLWRNLALGDVWVWLMNGATVRSVAYVDTVDLGYEVKGVADLDADTKADIVWAGAAGDVWMWRMDGATRLSQAYIGTVADPQYQIERVADFDGNGTADLLWWHAVQGELWIWWMNGATVVSEDYVWRVPDTQFRIEAAADYDGDGRADLLWRHAVTGDVWQWLMDGATRRTDTYLGPVPDLGYQIIGR